MSRGRKKEGLDFEIQFYEGVLRDSPNHLEALRSLAEAYTCQGYYEKGLSADLSLAKLCPDDATVFYNLACSYALLKRSADAMLALQKALTLGYDDFKHLSKDPDLVTLHNEPAFKAILEAEKKT